MADARLVERLRASQRILVFCGAGVSTASGIPDFRGPGGVWTRRRPVLYAEFLASDAARVGTWDYKLESWDIYQRARPNPVHDAIVALERAGKVAAVVTQNVDGLHRRAGTSPGMLVELHGTDLLVECQRCHATSEPAPHFASFQATRRRVAWKLAKCGRGVRWSRGTFLDCRHSTRRSVPCSSTSSPGGQRADPRFRPLLRDHRRQPSPRVPSATIAW